MYNKHYVSTLLFQPPLPSLYIETTRDVDVYHVEGDGNHVKLCTLSDVNCTETYQALRDWHIRHLPEPMPPLNADFIFCDSLGVEIVDEDSMPILNVIYVAAE